jgi:hypothetical protein
VKRPEVCGSSARWIGEGCRVEPRRCRGRRGGRGGMIDAGEEYVCIVEGYILSLGETTLEESRSGEGCWGDV